MQAPASPRQRPCVAAPGTAVRVLSGKHAGRTGTTVSTAFSWITVVLDDQPGGGSGESVHMRKVDLSATSSLALPPLGAAAAEAAAEAAAPPPTEAAEEEAAAEATEEDAEAEAAAEEAAEEFADQAVAEAAGAGAGTESEVAAEAAEAAAEAEAGAAEMAEDVALVEAPAASPVETASVASRPPTPRTPPAQSGADSTFADIDLAAITAQRRVVAQARRSQESHLLSLKRAPPSYAPPDDIADGLDYATSQAEAVRQHMEAQRVFLEGLEAARAAAEKSRAAAIAAQTLLDNLQEAKVHQDQRAAKEQEARATFATLAAANDRGDYGGAHNAAVAYAALVEEVKDLKDNEVAAKERILARASVSS